MFYLPVLRDQVTHLQLHLIAGSSSIQRRGAEWRQRGQRGGGAWSTNGLQSLFAHRFPSRLILKERERGRKRKRLLAHALIQGYFFCSHSGSSTLWLLGVWCLALGRCWWMELIQISLLAYWPWVWWLKLDIFLCPSDLKSPLSIWLLLLWLIWYAA